MLPVSQVGVDDSLISGLAGCVQCQTQSVGVWLTLEPMEMELVISIINDIATESTERKRSNLIVKYQYFSLLIRLINFIGLYKLYCTGYVHVLYNVHVL